MGGTGKYVSVVYANADEGSESECARRKSAGDGTCGYYLVRASQQIGYNGSGILRPGRFLRGEGVRRRVARRRLVLRARSGPAARGHRRGASVESERPCASSCFHTRRRIASA